MPYFDATVELWHDDLALLGSYKLVPGMPAEVLIKTGSELSSLCHVAHTKHVRDLDD